MSEPTTQLMLLMRSRLTKEIREPLSDFKGDVAGGEITQNQPPYYEAQPCDLTFQGRMNTSGKGMKYTHRMLAAPAELATSRLVDGLMKLVHAIRVKF